MTKRISSLLLVMSTAVAFPWDNRFFQTANTTTSTCSSGSTICIDYMNECSMMYGGCIDTCSMPHSFTAPPCPASSTVADTIPTENAGLFTLSPTTPDNPAKTTVTVATETDVVSPPSAPVDDAPQPTGPGVLEPNAIHAKAEVPEPALLNDDQPAPVAVITPPSATTTTQDANVTPAPAPAPPAEEEHDDAPVECGKRTLCVDMINTCGKRYGGCYDKCKGKPSNVFRPPPCTDSGSGAVLAGGAGGRTGRTGRDGSAPKA